MPGWHERTRTLQKEGKLQLLGIIQEQHPQRCRLFMQWKQMEWPILVDSLDLLGVSAVPLTFAIDEHGTIRSTSPTRSWLEDFVGSAGSSAGSNAGGSTGGSAPPPGSDVPPRGAGADSWIAHADRLFLRQDPGDLTRSIESYRRALELRGPPEAHFRLGVALRRRYESSRRQPHDFQEAFTSFTMALDLNPGQYIWRRRLQQYGPLLEKPYAFYDWVEEAREDIARRGEKPVDLPVEPRGSEIASPARSFEAGPPGKEPDPEGRIHRDLKQLIRVESAVAPAVVTRGGVARVHLAFRPSEKLEAHWNNESGNLVVWINPPAGMELESYSHEFPCPPEPSSRELREVEFEVRVPRGHSSSRPSIPGYALYYVCEGLEGTCRYLRQDFRVELGIRSSP